MTCLGEMVWIGISSSVNLRHLRVFWSTRELWIPHSQKRSSNKSMLTSIGRYTRDFYRAERELEGYWYSALGFIADSNTAALKGQKTVFLPSHLRSSASFSCRLILGSKLTLPKGSNLNVLTDEAHCVAVAESTFDVLDVPYPLLQYDYCFLVVSHTEKKLRRRALLPGITQDRKLQPKEAQHAAALCQRKTRWPSRYNPFR